MSKEEQALAKSIRDNEASLFWEGDPEYEATAIDVHKSLKALGYVIVFNPEQAEKAE